MTSRFRSSIAPLCLAAVTIAALTSSAAVHRQPTGLAQLMPTSGSGSMHLHRAWPHKTIPPNAYLRSVEKREAMAARAAASPTLRWRALGPRAIYRTTYRPSGKGRGAVSGRVTSLALHPRNADTAYLGSAGGGVWKTTDGGRRWKPTFDDQLSLNIGAIALDPTHPNIVYAGTGEANAWYFSPTSTGLMRSTDGGRTWRRFGADIFSNCFFGDLDVAGDETGSIFAGITSGYLNTGTETVPPTCPANGVWRSTDRARTWTNVLPGTIWDVAVDPERPEIVYAAASGVLSSQWGGFTAGIFKSLDGGSTWIKLAGGLPPEGFSRVALTVSKANPDRLYAAFVTARNNTMMGAWTSMDGGLSWIPVASDRQPCSYQNGSPFEDVSQCFYDFTIEASPKDETEFYVGGIVIVRYSATGVGGDLVGDGSGGIHVDQHALAFDRAGRLWVGNDGGVYRSSSRGERWKNLNGTLAVTQFYPGIAGSLKMHVLGGSQDNGTSMYTGEKRWTGVLGADGGFAAVDPKNPKLMYGSYQNLYLLRSNTGGLTWKPAITGIASGEARDFIAPMVMDPTSSKTLYAGTTRVYRSTNRAKSWAPISDALGGVVLAIARSPHRSPKPVIWAGTSNSQLWVTTDGGTSWTETSVNGLPTRAIFDIAFSPRDPKAVFVTMGGYGSSHVFVTRDNGTTWKDISGDLPDSPAGAITVDRSGVIYVGMDAGMFSSANGGKTWRVESRGLPNTMVMDLLIDKRSNNLIAATHGRGMFAARLP